VQVCICFSWAFNLLG